MFKLQLLLQLSHLVLLLSLQIQDHLGVLLLRLLQNLIRLNLLLLHLHLEIVKAGGQLLQLMPENIFESELIDVDSQRYPPHICLIKGE